MNREGWDQQLWEQICADERVKRAEQTARDYLHGDVERIFTQGFTTISAQLSAARLRVGLEIQKRIKEART